jgi:hypothetical protein
LSAASGSPFARHTASTIGTIGVHQYIKEGRGKFLKLFVVWEARSRQLEQSSGVCSGDRPEHRELHRVVPRERDVCPAFIVKFRVHIQQVRGRLVATVLHLDRVWATMERHHDQRDGASVNERGLLTAKLIGHRSDRSSARFSGPDILPLLG